MSFYRPPRKDLARGLFAALALAGAFAINAQTPATQPATSPSFKTRDAVEVFDGSNWKAGTVVERNGTEATGILYRVAYEGWDKPFFHDWVSANAVRRPNDQSVTPPPQAQVVRLSVSNDTPAKALIAARKELASKRAATIVTVGQPAAETANHGGSKLPQAVSVDLASIPEVTITPAATWSFKPPTTPVAIVKSTRILHQPADVFDQLSTVIRVGPHVLVAHRRRLADDDTCHVEVLDTTQAVSRGATRLPLLFHPIGLAAAGERLVAAREEETPGQYYLAVTSTKPTQATISHLLSISLPHDGEGIQFVASPSPDLVILRASTTLFALNLDAGTLSWKLPFDGYFTTAPSPDHKSFALLHDGTVYLLDSTTAGVLGSVRTSGQLFGQLAFLDGMLILSSANTVTTFDLSTGKVIGFFGLPVPPPNSSRAFHVAQVAGLPKGAAVFGSYLLDLSSTSIVSQLQRGPDRAAAYFNDLVISTRNDNPNPFASARRDPGNAPRFLRQARITGKSSLGLPPLTLAGQKVALQISGGDEAQQIEVRKALTSTLTALGTTIDDTAPLKFVVSTSDGKSEQRTYTLTGKRSGEKVTRTMSERITTLALEDSGTTIWQQQWTKSPSFMVSTRGDQTFEQALDEADRHDIRPAATAAIPGVFVRPPAANMPQLDWD